MMVPMGRKLTYTQGLCVCVPGGGGGGGGGRACLWLTHRCSGSDLSGFNYCYTVCARLFLVPRICCDICTGGFSSLLPMSI